MGLVLKHGGIIKEESLNKQVYIETNSTNTQCVLGNSPIGPSSFMIFNIQIHGSTKVLYCIENEDDYILNRWIEHP